MATAGNQQPPNQRLADALPSETLRAAGMPGGVKCQLETAATKANASPCASNEPSTAATQRLARVLCVGRGATENNRPVQNRHAPIFVNPDLLQPGSKAPGVEFTTHRFAAAVGAIIQITARQLAVPAPVDFEAQFVAIGIGKHPGRLLIQPVLRSRAHDFGLLRRRIHRDQHQRQPRRCAALPNMRSSSRQWLQSSDQNASRNGLPRCAPTICCRLPLTNGRSGSAATAPDSNNGESNRLRIDQCSRQWRQFDHFQPALGHVPDQENTLLPAQLWMIGGRFARHLASAVRGAPQLFPPSVDCCTRMADCLPSNSFHASSNALFGRQTMDAPPGVRIADADDVGRFVAARSHAAINSRLRRPPRLNHVRCRVPLPAMLRQFRTMMRAGVDLPLVEI